MYLVKNNRSPYYQIIYKENGRITSKSTGKKLKSEALKFLMEFKKEVEKRKKLMPVKLSEFYEEYLQFVSVKSASYQRSVKLSFKQFRAFLGEDKILIKISVRDVERFIYEVFSRSHSGAGLYYRTLKASFNKAVDWGYIETNPFNSVKLPKTAKNLPVFISKEELKRIVEETREDFLKALFITAFYTGMRLGEIINLKVGDVDFERRLITVRNTETFTTKSKKERIIPISDDLFGVLFDYKLKVAKIDAKPGDYFFYRIKGIRLTADYVSKKFKKSVLKAGINPKVHFHSLRHSTASLLAQRGVSLLVIKELLGHSTLKVTEKYSHLQRSDLENAIRKFSDVI